MTHKRSPKPAGRTLPEVFAPLDEAQLRRREKDLLRRAALVAEFGWDQFRYQWSSGEVLGTALILDDHEEIVHWTETVESVLSRWAFDLWGIREGQTDVNAGCPATLAWFETARGRLARNRSTPAITRKG